VATAPIGVDVDLLLAASSFITSFNGRRDPRAEAALVAVATAYCNGSDLLLPLLSQRLADVPDFSSLWLKRPGLKTIPCAELSEKDFEAVAAGGAAHFAAYAERDAANVAGWLEFQFSPAVSDIYHDAADVEALVRCAEIAGEFIEKRQAPHLEAAIQKLQQAHLLSAPRLYVRLGEDDEIFSFAHLCLAFATSAVLRGYAYAAALSQHGNAPLYRHHWVRSPIVQKIGADSDAFRADAKTETITHFPWGEILRRVFDPDSPVIEREAQGVGHVFDEIRKRADRVGKEMRGGLLKNLLHADRDRTNEAEELVFEILREVGVFKKDVKKTAELKQKALCSLKELAARRDLFQSEVELVSGNLQQGWLKGRGSQLKMRFRRDRFWAVMEETSLIPASAEDKK
jgi:hypothetical protein